MMPRKDFSQGSMERKTKHGATAMHIGNTATHNGDCVTDAIMILRRDLRDAETFHELYGVPYEKAELFKKSNMRVAMINICATMLANPERYSKKWDQNRQYEFENRIFDFLNPSGDGKVKWSNGY
ncbi:hypothetical protein HOY82DRAFT_537798 [Tuber indicum]|nr:hypothetical protein HOY82DRAFT_537798 [Tuber indicum]